MITAKGSRGVVALIGPQVANTGAITTPAGSTVLAAGNKVSVDFTGDGLINLTVDSGVLNAAVENSGTITAEGGLVVMSAMSADNVTQSAVNNSGIIIATALHHRDGKIILDSSDGVTTLAGTVDVSAREGDGGQIIAMGGQIDVVDGVNPKGNEMLLVAPTVANIRVRVDGVTQQLEFTPDRSHNEERHSVFGDRARQYSGEITLGKNDNYADYRVLTSATKAIIVETGDGSKIYDATALAKDLAINIVGVGDSGYSADALVFTTSSKDVGSNYAILLGSDSNQLSSDYAVGYFTGKYNITKASATVIGNSKSVTYNGYEQGVNGFTVTGLVGGETAEVLAGVSASGSGKNAGQYDVIAIGDDSNYNLTFKNGLLDIGKADAIVTGNSQSVTYNGAVQSVNGFTVDGLVGGETAGVLTGVSVNGSGKNAGQYDVVASGDDSNYNFTFRNGLLDIGKAYATVTADSKNFIYNGSMQSVTGFTATGLVGGETESVLTEVTATGSGRNAGQYDVIASGSDTNYNLTFKNGVLDIGRKSITISGIAASDKYDDGTVTAVTNTSGASGWIQGDQLLVSSGGVFDSPAAGTWNVALTSNYSGADVDNYIITDQLNTMATIKALVLPPNTAKPVDPVTITVTGTPTLTTVSGLVIQYNNVPTQTETPAGATISGEISVSVPVATLQTGASFTIPLPSDIQTAATTHGGETATLLDGTALPSWIKYDAESKTFRVSNAGQSELGTAVTVLLTINGETWDIVLSTQQ